ncbi:MAG: exo-alpha-sialidase [Akkermansiaceae bacterium]|jgi:sialidase-1|nr:exo-alpha-sialidase [Akkermansiaceae bacterium]
MLLHPSLRALTGLFFFTLFLTGWLRAEHVKVFVLTGQSNSLGTTNGAESELTPGADPADAHIRFWWHNVADATTSLGNSGGVFTTLQEQQGGYYAGSSKHWGPEIGFGRTLYRAGVRNFAIVKASRGGGGNTNWSKAAGGHMYQHVLSTVTAATAALTTAGDTFEIAGLLYFQGESDNSSEADIAGTRFKEFIDDLRTDLPNATNLHGMIGGIAASGSVRDTVRARHESIAAATPYIGFFPNLDLQTETTDGLHFNKAAKLRIGGRFARAFLDAGIVSRQYGKLVFVGDSITQGGNGDRPGYRYQVFKRLAERNVPIDPANGYKFTGSVSGPYQNSALTTPEVNGQAFENIHEGHWGWRASWINARVRLPSNRRDANRGEGTLLNWTGQASPQTYLISAPDADVPYPDSAAVGTGNNGTHYVPDTASIMIGINDLGDDPASSAQVVADIGTMIDQLRAANPNVRIFINRLLHTNQTQAMRDAVDAVNAALPALVETKNTASATSPVWIIDASTGFDPVTMTYDNVHPNAVGEAYVGDRMAAAFGLIEEPIAAALSPPPHIASSSADFPSRFEGHEIWNGTAFVNSWTQTGTLNKTLPEPTDLRIIHPSTGGRWIEGTAAGWSALASGSWTLEARLKCHANANGFILWCGVGSRRILVEIHGNRTQDHADGGQSFNVSHNNLDGDFHIFRIVHDAAAARYHVFRDGVRLSPLAGTPYDQTAADSRLILGDYTSGTFGNAFDITLDHLRFSPGAFLPPGTDSDADGMSDAWEYEYFSTLTGADPNGDPDEDGSSNLTEFINGTDPIVADTTASNPLPVHILTGGGNALGSPLTTSLGSLPVGQHPAEQTGGVWLFEGGSWRILSARTDGSYGPEIAFARMLWDAGYRGFGIVKSARSSGGNTLWQKPAGAAWLDLLAAAQAAAGSPPGGFDSLTFRSLLYVQGETNDATEADAAGTRFSELLAHLRADLPGASGLQGILGEIGGSGTARDTTRARHASLAVADPDIGIARATGMTTHNLDGLGSNYDANSIFLLGARLAAEAIAMGIAGPKPLPAWASLHGWYLADHGAAFDAAGAVTRWAALQDGGATRDLARRVSGQVFRKSVTTAGGPRAVMGFDGTNDLWANGSSEFGTLTGPRSMAVLCRVRSGVQGTLFDGSTNTGRTRAQVRAGSWQAGITASGTGNAWNLEEPVTAPATATWQRHVFTFTPGAGSTTTVVEHWIDGVLAATVTDSGSTSLGGLILGSNGGSPFTKLAVDIAEVAVFSKALDAAEVAALDARWLAAWGTPTGPPFAVQVTQQAREVPRFGEHAVIEIPITAESSGATTIDTATFELRESQPGTVAKWRLHLGDPLRPAPVALAEIAGGVSTWSPTLTLPLQEGVNRLFLSAVPARHAALGNTFDAALTSLSVSGTPSGVISPTASDPAGELSLALVPMFTDVVLSGDLGINTFRIPGIVCDSDGVLHAVYDHRYSGGADLPANVDVGYARSTDGGATWTTSQVILDFDATVPGSSGNGVGDPAILHDPVTDTLWVAALWSFGNNGWAGSGPGIDPADTGQYVLTKSTDGGLTWSPPINVTAAVKDDPNWRLIFQGPGHGLAMRDGTLVFPSQYRDASGVSRVCSVFSSDHGETWDFGSGVPTSSPQTNENTVCELDDGRLLFSMRTPSGSNGQRAWIRYLPGGATPMRDGSWESLFRLPAVPDPVCQGSVIQWTSVHRGDPAGWTLFGNPASSSSRIQFTLRASADGGDSWPVSRLLYSGSSAYSSLCILPDKSIGVFFEKDNYTRITFARVEADWLLNPTDDVDADGMPDAWENLTGLNPASDDSQIDSDGDGIFNEAEYAAGTHPRDATSFFAVSSFTAGEALDLKWRSVPGRAYAVESSEALGAWSVLPGFGSVIATSAETGIELPSDSASRRFYRIRVLP